MASLLCLENAIAATSSHASNVEKLGSVDEMIIYCDEPVTSMNVDDRRTFATSYANTPRLHLKTEATLIFPQRGCDTRF